MLTHRVSYPKCYRHWADNLKVAPRTVESFDGYSIIRIRLLTGENVFIAYHGSTDGASLRADGTQHGAHLAIRYDRQAVLKSAAAARERLAASPVNASQFLDSELDAALDAAAAESDTVLDNLLHEEKITLDNVSGVV